MDSLSAIGTALRDLRGYQNGSYSVSSLSVVLNGSYTLTGYYDGSLTSATRLRVIVAS